MEKYKALSYLFFTSLKESPYLMKGCEAFYVETK